MSGRESKLQKTCINWCNKHGLLAVNIHGGGWGNKGFPDLLIFKNGRAVAVELKNGNAYTQQPIQKMWQQKFEQVKTPYLVIHSFSEFQEQVERNFKK